MSSSPNVFDRLADDQETRAQLVRATILELQTNPAYQPYFAGYTPDSVEAFIEQYAQRKARYVFDGPRRSKYFEAESTEVQERAQARLWDIQQKKLFDLQCKWRAGLFQHPAIHVTDQFDYWGRHPDRCPFLPPITPDEVALYQDYLADPDCREGDWTRQRHSPDWQGYMNLRATYYEDELALLPPDSHVFDEDEDDEEDADDYDEDDEDDDDWGEEEDDQPAYPAWYRFYDQHHGTGHLRHLPNLRGMRQQYYQDLHLRNSWMKPTSPPPPPPSPAAEAPAAEPSPVEPPAPIAEAVVEPAPPPPAPYVPETRPWLSMHDEATFRMIVETFDPTPGLLELRRAQEQGLEDRDNEESEAALLALHNLANSRLVIPIDMHTADWRLALREAELVLRCRQLARALPGAYDDYCQRQQLGLAQNPPLSASYGDEPEEPWNINYKREQVLNGRELAGEPRDFNY